MTHKRQGIMLCYPFEEKRLAKWTPPFIIQPKLDGDRCRAIIGPEGDVVLLSSEENIIESVPHINEALKNLHLRNVELDGELYIHGAPHEAIHSIVGRTENIHKDYSLMEYHIFDIVSSEPQVERTNKLLNTIPNRQNRREFGPLHLVPVSLVYNIEDIMRVEDAYEKENYEGFVLRDATCPYVRKRSTQMMKFKPRKEDFYEIVGWKQETDIHGNVKEALGALLCKGFDATTFSVGSGSLLTRENRENLWKVKETLVGKLAHVKYQHLTTKERVPRFPVIVDVI